MSETTVTIETGTASEPRKEKAKTTGQILLSALITAFVAFITNLVTNFMNNLAEKWQQNVKDRGEVKAAA